MAISLNASTEGLELADSARKIKGWTKTSQRCCDAAHTSVATLKRFWQGTHIRRETFISICTALEVNWREIALEAEHSEISLQSNPINSLVQGNRPKIKFSFEYGNSINQQQSLQWIQNNFIDLDLIEVTFLPSEYPVPDASLLKGKDSNDDFDRLGLHFLKGDKTNSKQVLNNFHNIFIYGEPGSGKSTYLKWVALKCRAGELLSSYIPIFIEIRQFAATSPEETLVTFIREQFNQYNISSEDTYNLLKGGNVIFILDGFDETPMQEWNRIKNAIEEVLLVYSECRFLCSSRLATQFPFFNGFQKIIIAPFESTQKIPQFIEQWFRQAGKKSTMATAMMDKLRSKEFHGVRELARRPILLKMLCIIFEFQEDFPTKRAEVFSMGIDRMMNSTHKVETHIDKIPTLEKHHVENILRRIANHFFVESDFKLLFQITEVERIIEDYFIEVYGIHRDVIPASTILNGIEQSTGLIVRWAQNLCAFSHLTYQEFFVANNLVRNQEQHVVYQHIQDSRWNFVIGLVAELLPKDKSLDFLSCMKQAIDQPIKNQDQNKALSEYFKILEAAADRAFLSLDSKPLHFKAYTRAWYFAYALEDRGKINSLSSSTKTFDLPYIEAATSTINSPLLEGHDLIYKTYHYLSQESYSRSFSQLLKRIQSFLEKQADKTPQTTEVISGWLSAIKSEQLQFESKSEWWTAKKERWTTRVVRLIADNLKLPCTFHLTKEQIAQLRKYYESTKLLSNCMNRAQLQPEDCNELISSMLVLKEPNFGGFIGFDDGFIR
ncbi:MAG: NACHT domain-containing protein [Leptolyngbya sp. SIO3F4]|nr:NACHT domain-containing protein [Leptolyngbya sp. SIO3F4]